MEVEWKLLAANRLTLEGVTHRCAELGWKVVPGGRKRIFDIYYDTPDYSYFTNGGCVRRRVEGGVVKVTFKEPGRVENGLFQRPEREVPLYQIPSADPFAEQGLIATLHVHNSRRLFTLSYADAVVELALDSVSYRLGHRRTPTDHQVELELKSEGGLERLVSLGEALKTDSGFTPMTQSKYQRGMALLQC